ncbi:MAG: type II toxin-antitoxin system RelE/ParE family toxin [Nanoarchaeota archaeon]
MYEIVITKNAEAQLKKLNKPVQERIISVLERIRIRPESFVEKLVGETSFKLRVGDYRVILDINNKLIILVLKMGHRRNIDNSDNYNNVEHK